jgi:acetyl esterase/lipase
VEHDDTPVYLDLYVPDDCTRPLPIVVWLHGGGWMLGSHHGCPISDLALEGYAVASIGYRLNGLTTPTPFPAQLHDCKTAVRWLRRHGWRFGLDGTRMAVVGISAGGHLAALLGTTAGDQQLDGATGGADMPTTVQGVVTVAAPTDLPALEEIDPDHWRVRLVDLGLLDGRPSERPMLARLASPTTHADHDSAPFLILHGRDDTLVPSSQGERLHAALSASGADSSLYLFDHLTHGDAALDEWQVRSAMRDFLARILRPGPVTSDER